MLISLKMSQLADPIIQIRAWPQQQYAISALGLHQRRLLTFLRIRRSTSTLQALQNQGLKRPSPRSKSSCSKNCLTWSTSADSGVGSPNNSNVMSSEEYVSFVFLIGNSGSFKPAAQMARRAYTDRYGACPGL